MVNIMFLTNNELQQAIETVKTAFPYFSDWQYINEPDSDYLGFTMWGKFVINSDEIMSRIFFITFNKYQEKWSGTLTIGQHNYFWSSADFGDAHLLNTTDNYDLLEDAIAALKTEILKFFTALSVV